MLLSRSIHPFPFPLPSRKARKGYSQYEGTAIETWLHVPGVLQDEDGRGREANAVDEDMSRLMGAHVVLCFDA